MTQIIPAILATTKNSYKEQIDKLQSCGEFDDGWVHIDFMDNIFVQSKSVGTDVVKMYPITSQKEAHLMVSDPKNWIPQLVDLGFKRIVFPIEVGNTKELIEEIKKNELEVGISINPETPVAKVIPFVGTIDVVLVMDIHPGKQGQNLLPETYKRIEELKEFRGQNEFDIEVDGGVNDENLKELIKKGADNLVIGSFLFDGNITENLEKIWEALFFS